MSNRRWRGLGFGPRGSQNSGGDNSSAGSGDGGNPPNPDPQPEELPAQEDLPITDSEYSRKAKLLIALANDLNALGGAQFDLDIPFLAFIGNQSAGKSSVVEAATGIAVPRESGTCTRVPMKCTMIQSTGRWSCEIKLQFSYDASGRPRLSPMTLPFKKVTQPKDVELWLKRAQAAILSYPTHQPDHFHDMTSAELRAFRTTSPFSLNTIEIIVRDPEGTNLCFVDLPGIIQHHPDDESLVGLVKNIVKEHIRKQNTIIVVTIPMTDDIENQEAFQIAKRADRNGTRTIGVGTKPDLLHDGNTSSLQSWRKILEGESSHLSLGYFCVKMPDDETRRRGLPRSELARQEKEFFETRAPWKDLENQSRLGMQNFVESMSTLLITLIERNIPVIKRTVDDLLKKEQAELAKLPPPPVFDNPAAQVTRLIGKFCRFLEGTIRGDHNKKFIHKNKERYEAFSNEIRETAPDLRNQHAGTPLGPAPCAIHVDHVTEIIRSHRTWEFPGYIHFEATKELILRHVVLWKPSFVNCFEDISHATMALINKCIVDDECFGRFYRLQALVKLVVKDQKEFFVKETSTMLQKLFDLENSNPLWTSNNPAFNEARSTWLNAIYGNYANQNYSSEHRVMADVHAYFQVAHTRFVDNVVMSIEGEWHQKLVSSLETKLTDALPYDSSERMQELLQENPKIAEKRKTLETRIDHLVRIKERVREYEQAAGVEFDGLTDEDHESVLESQSEHARSLSENN